MKYQDHCRTELVSTPSVTTCTEVHSGSGSVPRVVSMTADVTSAARIQAVVSLSVRGRLGGPGRRSEPVTSSPPAPRAPLRHRTRLVRWVPCCLLYTSDAADDLTRVDLGG